MAQRKEVPMKFLKQNSVNLLIALCELVIGILLLINPTGFTSGIIIAFGAASLIFGIILIVFYWRKPFTEAVSRLYLMKGLLCASLGLFCICFSRWFLETFALLSFLYGVLLLVFGFYKIQWSVDLLRQKEKRWGLGGAGAALTVVLSLLIIINPFSSASLTWILVAVSLIAQSVIDIAMLLLIRVFVNAHLPKKHFPKKKQKEPQEEQSTAPDTDTNAESNMGTDTSTGAEPKAPQE